MAFCIWVAESLSGVCFTSGPVHIHGDEDMFSELALGWVWYLFCTPSSVICLAESGKDKLKYTDMNLVMCERT